MASVKNITLDSSKARPQRKSKEEAIKKMDDKNIVDDESEELDAHRKTVKKNVKDVKVNHTAEDSELNLKLQYQKRISYCDRDLIKIDDDGGSKEKNGKKYVKVVAQTGMFEIMKKNMMKVLIEDMKVKVAKDEMVETYGSQHAEAKIHLFLMFDYLGKNYETKVDVFNTNCSFGINSSGKGSDTARLDGMTIAEYFVKHFRLPTATILTAKFVVNEVNEQCREMASMALHHMHKKKSACFDCGKEVKAETSLKDFTLNLCSQETEKGSCSIK